MVSNSNHCRARNNENDNSNHQSKDNQPSQTRSSRRPLQDVNTDTGRADAASDDADADRIRQLEDALARKQAECNELRHQQTQQPSTVPLDSPDIIPRPINASTVKMAELREELGCTKSRWNALRSSVRYALAAARLDWNKSWKAQDPKKKVKALNVVFADFPETKRFENGWGVMRLAQEAWSNRKSYGRCVDDPNTYRGRTTIERRRRRRRSVSPREPDEPPRSSHSPTPGPSSASVRRPRSSSDDEEDDDLLNFSGDHDDDNEEPPQKRARTA
ncbi:hypothetical protein R3P38DRAFT_3190257 [Favolaschia claudopus]|uniref:Uncharacterized protein n=1 Tax=Favolaschia claudopus TaxID=2862362 RepID=A0AAW0BQ05_9AGAR